MTIIIYSVFALMECFFSFSRESYETAPSGELTTYYLIRHAEKDLSVPGEKDPVLSSVGKERAAHWADFFSKIKLDAVHSTNYRRTLSTAGPIAEIQKVEIQIYEPREIFSENFLTSNKGKTILIVGHSNTTPGFANFVLKENKFPILKENEFGILYILTVDEKGEVRYQVKNIDKI